MTGIATLSEAAPSVRSTIYILYRMPLCSAPARARRGHSGSERALNNFVRFAIEEASKRL